MYVGDSIYELKRADYTAGKMVGKVLKTQEEVKDASYVGFYIPKILPLMDATNGPEETSYDIDKSIFANSVNCESSIPVANYIKCKYVTYSNMSQPIIALGESAYCYFFDGDYKHPFYTNEYSEERRRKTDILEVYVYGKPDSDYVPDDYYKIVLNSKDKKLFLHTSKENGEKYTYDFIIDAEEGTTEIKDDTGNSLKLITKDKHWKMINATGSFIEIKDKDGDIYVPGDFGIKCNNLKVDAKISIEEKAGAKIEITAPKIDIKGDAAVTVNTAIMTFNVSGILKSTAPMNKFDVAATINTLLVEAMFTSTAPTNKCEGLVVARMFMIG